jgi:bZIP transcription factor
MLSKVLTFDTMPVDLQKDPSLSMPAPDSSLLFKGIRLQKDALFPPKCLIPCFPAVFLLSTFIKNTHFFQRSACQHSIFIRLSYCLIELILIRFVYCQGAKVPVPVLWTRTILCQALQAAHLLHLPYRILQKYRQLPSPKPCQCVRPFRHHARRVTDSPQRFPSHSWPTRLHGRNSLDFALPQDYTSWSSLQITQSKKQKTSGGTIINPKQQNSSYHSVDSTNLAMADSSLIPAQRRRAQNRASQRAFRERKERHVKNLEQQLEDLHQQYEGVLRAYDEQREEIFNLKAELRELHSENETSQGPRNSPLEFASTMHAQRFQSEVNTLQLPRNDILIPQSQSTTPASNLETTNSASRVIASSYSGRKLR